MLVLLACGSRLPDGPAPVAWDRQPCAHCRMLVGEPAYAAQLITTDGDVVYFDDPGCLMRYQDERRPAIHRLWFHDSAGGGWLGGDAVGFVAGAATPMGYGLAAVPRATAGAIDLATARHVLAARAADRAPPGGAP
jgi:copper chaperone NosL